MAVERVVKPQVVQLPAFEDDRGVLAVGDAAALGFVPRRAFWIWHASQPRGNHAHKACTQAVVAVAGSFRVRCGEVDLRLASPRFACLVPPGFVLTLDEFSGNGVALVLCSHDFDKEDYVGS